MLLYFGERRWNIYEYDLSEQCIGDIILWHSIKSLIYLNISHYTDMPHHIKCLGFTFTVNSLFVYDNDDESTKGDALCRRPLKLK